MYVRADHFVVKPDRILAAIETLLSWIGEQRTLMKRILKNLNLDPKKWNERAILGTISNRKNDLLDGGLCTPKSLLNVTKAYQGTSS